MSSYSKNDVVLVRYRFSQLADAKIRPAVVVGMPQDSLDVFLVPLTSKLSVLLPGEFVLEDWAGAGLNVASGVKRGIYTAHQSAVIQTVGKLVGADAAKLEESLRDWLDLR